MTLSRLKDMTTIFMGNKTFGYVPSKTYIFVPYGCPLEESYGHVYVSGRGSHAEDQMYNKCGLPPKFYLTSAPCPDCAVMLLEKYNLMSYKPTIYIGRPYTGKGKSGGGNKNVNLQCLAMLVQKGFKLKAWDWSYFAVKYDFTNDSCSAVVRKMFSPQWGGVYNKRYQGTVNTLAKVSEDAASNTDFENLCRGALQG